MPPTLDARKARIFERLTAIYDELAQYSRIQQNTSYGCRQSGRCCKVGLELHWAECEWIARHLADEFARDPRARPRRVRALSHALTDEAWRAADGYGEQWCAFFREGCSVYAFRPAVCRMYGPLLAVDDECPRERMVGRPHVYYGPDVDDLVQRMNRVFDDYGKLTGRDRSIYMPSGVLTFLLPKVDLRELRRRTHSRFWRTSHGYRTQFVPERTRIRQTRELEATARAAGAPLIPILPRPQAPAHALAIP